LVRIVKQQVGVTQCAKSEPMELEASKVERKMPMPKSEAQQSHPLGLPNWQMKKLQKLNAEELKAWNLHRYQNEVYKFMRGRIV
jgi:hypothetical protein